MKLAKKFAIALISLPLSAFIILIVYSFMYLFLGQELYIIEIGALKDFSILVKEFLVLAISMFIAILIFQISYENIIEKENKVPTKVFHMIAMIICSGVLPTILTEYLLSDLELFCTVFYILWVTIIAVAALIFSIKDFIDVWIVNKKINKVK